MQDVETASKEAQNRIEQLSYGKQRPWRNSRGDFSGILLPEPNIEALCMPLMLVKWLMLAAGVLAAILVIFIFWLLLQSIDMGCTVQSSRHGVGCPEDSCFCTDCDLCKIYLDERHWQEFSCQMLGLPLNRCRLTLLANAGWLVAASKLGWQTCRKCGRDPGQLLLVVVPCVLSATSAVPLWQIYVSLSWKVFFFFHSCRDIQCHQYLLTGFLHVHCTATGFTSAKAKMLWASLRHVVQAVFAKLPASCNAWGILRHASDKVD